MDMCARIAHPLQCLLYRSRTNQRRIRAPVEKFGRAPTARDTAHHQAVLLGSVACFRACLPRYGRPWTRSLPGHLPTPSASLVTLYLALTLITSPLTTHALKHTRTYQTASCTLIFTHHSPIPCRLPSSRPSLTSTAVPRQWLITPRAACLPRPTKVHTKASRKVQT